MAHWITVLAIAAFLVSFGQFLDTYHISNRLKDRVRLLLVGGFVYLDSISIPDAPRATLAFLLRPRQRVTLGFGTCLYVLSLALTGITLYWLFYSLPEFAISVVLTIGIIGGLIQYVSWIHIFEGVLAALVWLTAFFLIPILSFVVLRWSFRMLYDRKSTFLRFVSPGVSIFIGLVLAVLLPLLSAELGFVDDYISVAFMFAFLSPVVIFTCMMIVVSLLKIFVELLKKIIMVIFQAASDPKTSPFSYAAALGGVLIVGAKLVLGGGAN